MSDTKKEIKKKCNLCGTTEGNMVSGKDGFVCFKCIGVCHSRIQSKKKDSVNAKVAGGMKPSMIKKLLDESVIDQDIAKTKLSVALYNHYKMNQYFDAFDGEPPILVERSNVMLLGPTGSGKTHILRALTRGYDLALGISDATTMTESGYVGKKI